MPARRPRSCPPPTSSGRSAHAAAHEQRPDALRPAELVRRQRQQVDAARRAPGSCRAACTASTCSSTPRARHTAAIASIGWIVPISLFAQPTLTSATSSSSCAATAGRARRGPSPSTGTSRTASPSRCKPRTTSRTDACSIGVVTTVRAARRPHRAAQSPGCCSRCRRW